MAADLPDVFLLSVFQKLDAEDRLNASQVCYNWFQRVREANQTVKCLTINLHYGTILSENNDKFILGYNPCFKEELKMREKIEEKNKQKFEYSTNLNTLNFSIITKLQLNSITVQKIIFAFPAITQLNFINKSFASKYEYLIKFLENDQKNQGWKDQLTTLRIIEITGVKVLPIINQRLFTAINALPVLEKLDIVLKSEDGLQLENLSVLARLKKVRFDHLKTKDFVTFLNFLQQYAADNAHLQIDLPNGFEMLFPPIINTQTPVSNFSPDTRLFKQIVRINNLPHLFHDLFKFKSISTSLPHLTSLSIICPYSSNGAELFSIISRQLPHLCHLKLAINFTKIRIRRNERLNDIVVRGQIIIPRPSSPLTSVKVLELDVTVKSHNKDLEWLNLPVTIPNVIAIHFLSFSCVKCKIHSHLINIAKTSLPKKLSVVARKCFETVLMQLNIQTSVSFKQITFDVNGGFISAKQLLD